MGEKSIEFPFKALGAHLKRARQKRSETIAEVSGAVEIDLDALADIEYGKQRPSEDILLLLISHFALKDEEADRLWHLAGYNLLDSLSPLDVSSDMPQVVMVMPFDARIAYTDMVHVVANNYGVVMNFMQSAGPANQPLAVSRIGMSKEHARSVIEILQKTLDQAEAPIKPKLLPQSDQTPNPDKASN